MRLKLLKSILQNFDTFESPSISLEQYATSPDTAANFLNVANMEYGDIEGKMVADLGAGCGILGIGAALLDAGFCVGFEIDAHALKIAEQNRDYAGCSNIDFIQCDVGTLETSRWHKQFDTVIMNPPFGTKNNKGIDVMFLNAAMSLATHSVLSLHKSSTIDHLYKVAKALNWKMEACYGLEFELPMTYKMHTKLSKDIDVHLLRFSPPILKSKKKKVKSEIRKLN